MLIGPATVFTNIIDYDRGLLTDKEVTEKGIARLPGNLEDALAALEADDVIAKALGSIIFKDESILSIR